MAEKRERVAFCLHRVNLEGAEKLYPAELSGGMIKRVAIARAIVMNPRYLFCDEPNSGLDPVTSNVIDRLIYDITKEYGITTIINTHDMNSVMEIGEKIVFINQGRKGWEGTSADILHTDNRALNDFVFASNMAKKVKEAARPQDSARRAMSPSSSKISCPGATAARISGSTGSPPGPRITESPSARGTGCGRAPMRSSGPRISTISSAGRPEAARACCTASVQGRQAARVVWDRFRRKPVSPMSSSSVSRSARQQAGPRVA